MTMGGKAPSLKGESIMKQDTATPKTARITYLLRSRANLNHLIYSMEHDRSLGASESKIGSLRRILNGIEKQIGHLPRPSPRPRV